MERDPLKSDNFPVFSHFNSHAHVERDWNVLILRRRKQISTHTLTWSVTARMSANSSMWSFQLTRSRGAWLNKKYVCFLLDEYFNSHAHVERDLWGTRKMLWFVKFQLTRSRGAWLWHYLRIRRYKLFQLTRSRGAWHLNFCILAIDWYFNSHAHVERDFINFTAHIAHKISTHTLTWSVTKWFAYNRLFNKDFNSHAHVERDNGESRKCHWHGHFNSHAHVERD